MKTRSEPEMKLTIPVLPLSPNKLRGKPWGMKKRLAKEWKELVRSAAIPNWECVTKRRVKITLHHAREYDQDNAYAACKPVIDALAHWNYIMDDSAEWLELTVEQAKCPHKQRHTTIEIEAAK